MGERPTATSTIERIDGTVKIIVVGLRNLSRVVIDVNLVRKVRVLIMRLKGRVT